MLEARIIATADVIDAMASHRPYRPALGVDIAMEEIVKHKGKLYDSNVVDACVRVYKAEGEKAFLQTRILCPRRSPLQCLKYRFR